jgi:hypothetical protein
MQQKITDDTGCVIHELLAFFPSIPGEILIGPKSSKRQKSATGRTCK